MGVSKLSAKVFFLKVNYSFNMWHRHTITLYDDNSIQWCYRCRNDTLHIGSLKSWAIFTFSP